MQLLREYFNQALPSSDVVRYPVAFLHLTVPPADVDVNLEPNKSRVLLHDKVTYYLLYMCAVSCAIRTRLTMLKFGYDIRTLFS